MTTRTAGRRTDQVRAKHACTNTNHLPPGTTERKPGIYKHVCPGCKETITFIVSGKRYNA